MARELLRQQPHPLSPHEAVTSTIASRWFWFGGVVVWIAALAIGMGWLVLHAKSTTLENEFLQLLPDAQQQTLPNGNPNAEPTILCFAHPHCVCTKATLVELASSLQKLDASANLFFFVPANAEQSWYRSATIECARENPKLVIQYDMGGKLANQFGVKHSGTVLLYDALGQIRFGGGVTASRGHVGDSDGAVALRESYRRHWHHEEEKCEYYPVYGCEIAPGTSEQD